VNLHSFSFPQFPLFPRFFRFSGCNSRCLFALHLKPGSRRVPDFLFSQIFLPRFLEPLYLLRITHFCPLPSPRFFLSGRWVMFNCSVRAFCSFPSAPGLNSLGLFWNPISHFSFSSLFCCLFLVCFINRAAFFFFRFPFSPWPRLTLCLTQRPLASRPQNALLWCFWGDCCDLLRTFRSLPSGFSRFSKSVSLTRVVRLSQFSGS